MHREASTYPERRCRALRAWLLQSRPARHVAGGGELDQGLAASGGPLPPSKPGEGSGALREAAVRPRPLPAARARIQAAIRARLARRRGPAVRVRPTLGEPGRPAKEPQIDLGLFERAREIAGRKRVTYSRRSNPWRQMTRMSLDTLPRALGGDDAPSSSSTRPISRSSGAADASPGAAGRAVGARRPRLARRLLPAPAAVGPRLELPQARSGRSRASRSVCPARSRAFRSPRSREFDVAHLPDGRAGARAPHALSATDVDEAAAPDDSRLQRERNHVRPPGARAARRRLSSGTRGRDVWILDMRTSCGMPTARLPWTLRGRRARRHSRRRSITSGMRPRTSARKEQDRIGIDVFAHCMGSVMFSMALLAPPEPGDPFFREREALPDARRPGRAVADRSRRRVHAGQRVPRLPDELPARVPAARRTTSSGSDRRRRSPTS